MTYRTQTVLIEHTEIYDASGFPISDPLIIEGYDINGFPCTRVITSFEV